MKNRKFWIMMGMVIMLVLLFSSCTTTTPFFYSNNCNYDFIIIGPVTYQNSTLFRTGFIDLLDAAKKQYPSSRVDYVIDIMIDHKKTTFLFIFRSSSYTMRGTAIQYVR